MSATLILTVIFKTTTVLEVIKITCNKRKAIRPPLPIDSCQQERKNSKKQIITITEDLQSTMIVVKMAMPVEHSYWMTSRSYRKEKEANMNAIEAITL